MRRRVLFILGPTAAGKTAVALRIAEQVACEVVSADSRQIYKYMSIGTAKPATTELAAVPHHFIDFLEPDQRYSAGQFGLAARDCIQGIFERGHQPLVVGGSGLYVRALVDGFFSRRIASDEVKAALRAEVGKSGLPVLYKRLQSVDPATAGRLPATDSQRILRALEVFEITGQPLSEFVLEKPQPADFDPVFVGLTWRRAELYRRIDARVDAMMRAGLVAEAEDLRRRGYGPELNALNTVGYKEVFAHLGGSLSLEETVKLIKQKTRNYAKRQLTWFRKDKRLTWLHFEDFVDSGDMAGNILHMLASGQPQTA